MGTQEIVSLVTETVSTQVFGVWFLIGAALVFFMQAGFAMVETGFTRAKNAGNIMSEENTRSLKLELWMVVSHMSAGSQT